MELSSPWWLQSFHQHISSRGEREIAENFIQDGMLVIVVVRPYRSYRERSDAAFGGGFVDRIGAMLQ